MLKMMVVANMDMDGSCGDGGFKEASLVRAVVPAPAETTVVPSVLMAVARIRSVCPLRSLNLVSSPPRIFHRLRQLSEKPCDDRSSLCGVLHCNDEI